MCGILQTEMNYIVEGRGIQDNENPFLYDRNDQYTEDKGTEYYFL